MTPSNEPTDVELRGRIRKWLRYYWRRSGLQRQEIAQAMRFKPPTISNLLNDKEDPGLDCFVRMHFVFGADMAHMVRFDPPSAAQEQAATRARK